MNPVIYIFLNKSLKMSVGKAAAQAAHATVMSVIATDGTGHMEWLNSPHRTIIVLEARDEAHMKNVRAYLAERKVSSVRIIDEGVNEIDPHVWTALATCILDKDAQYVKDVMSTFKLYRDTVRVTLEVDR